MRKFPGPLAVAVALFISLCSSGTVSAFHDGGVANCDGCHTMHNSGNVNPQMLKGSDPGSTCLNCHGGSSSDGAPDVASGDGSVYSPAGDFYWIKHDFAWDGGTSKGDNHGHNIIAMDYGFTADSALTKAPGGTYSSLFLSCTSCHDPHGQVNGGTAGGQPPVSGSGSYGSSSTGGADTIVGNYRLLGDASYNGGLQAGGYTFQASAPIAAANPENPYGESDSLHVDYGSGMSEWCTNCHMGYADGQISKTHRAGNEVHLNDLADIYNSYKSSGDHTGIIEGAYTQFVPFERGVTDRSQLNPASRSGPGKSANVMCLTCHRAHASAFDNMTRWDMKAEFLAQSHPRTGDVGFNPADEKAPYYGRDIAAEFGLYQRSFCNKCHAKD